MRCNYCQAELSPSADLDTCPSCGFPVGGESAAASGAVTLPAKSLQPQERAGTERPGSLRVTKKSEVCRGKCLLIAFLVDISGSMNGQKIREVLAGLTKMVHFLLPLGQKCEIAIVEFSDQASVAHSLRPPGDLEGKLALSSPDGATNIGAALRLGGTLLANHPIDKDSEQVMILLSDGDDTCSSLPVEEAATQKADGNLIITIAYGDDADRNLLRDIASSPDLFFAKGDGGQELETFLTDLGKTLTASIQTGQAVNRSVSRLG